MYSLAKYLLIWLVPAANLISASQPSCEHSTLSTSLQYAHPSWQSSNYSCAGPPQPWIVTPSPGKGLGVFATSTLEAGDVLLQEEAVLKITPPEFRDGVGYPLNAIGVLAEAAFETLTEEVKADILSLHIHKRATEKSDTMQQQLIYILRSNAYTSGDKVGLFPKIARINHSCRPNTSYFWSERLNKRIVYATRRIEEGEELSVSYIPLLFSQHDRQLRLDQYGFKCSCEACAAGRDEVQASDARRKKIQGYLSDLEPKLTLEEPKSMMGTKRAKEMAADSMELVKLVEEEGLADYLAQAFRIVAVTHARIKDWSTAALWAHKSYQIRLMADEGARETKEIAALTAKFIESWNESLRDESEKRQS